MAPNAAEAERLAEDTGLPATVTGLPRDQLAAANRACADLNFEQYRSAQAAGKRTDVQYGYWRGEDGRLHLTAKTTAVSRLKSRVRDIHRWAVARRDRRRPTCAAPAGRAPRAATNTRRRGSRRAASRASSRSGDSGDDGEPEPPGLAAGGHLTLAGAAV
jgi:hypothetical protein